MFFSERYKPGDDGLEQAMLFKKLMVDGLTGGDPLAFLPWLRIFPLPYLKTLREYVRVRDNYLHKRVGDHKLDYDENNLRDFADTMLKLTFDKPVQEGTGITTITDDYIEIMFSEMYIGGSETSISALRWCIVYLLHWPKYQDEVYDEIVSVVGKDRYPTLADRDSLPLTKAVVMETLRLASIVPNGVPRRTTEITTLNGKYIPKDAMVMFNIWNIHRDERHWKNPHEFNPHRWLDIDNKISVDDKSFMSFGLGKRKCIGASVAESYLFLILARLVKDFQINPEPCNPIPDLNGTAAITIIPKPFRVVLKLR